MQAAAQLKDTTVKLFKIGEEGVPTVDEYIKDTLSDGGVIGFDGRVVNAAWGKRLSEIAKEKHGSMYVNEDLIDLIWTDRPPMSKAPVMIFDNKYTGEDISSKLKRVREQMTQKGATLHLMSSLYDIAWLLNVRGGDISYVPVVLSYLALSQDSCIWFLQEEVVTETLKAYLDKNGIQTRPYDDFYEYVKHIDEKETVLLNTSIVNYRICDSLPDGVKVIDAEDPTVVMKAVKNEVQLENLRKAHLKDAVAMCKFMYWLKTNIGKIPMTEISASDYLASLRAEQEGFLDLSFATICGYADHGAIVHYSATEESDRQLKPESLLLVDSGGHYLEGTTDITRTFALGPVTDEMKDMFTRVCRSNMNLANAKFKEGCSGLNFDILAREPFWEIGMDYNHGTGHGVGYVLNVMEETTGGRLIQNYYRIGGLQADIDPHFVENVKALCKYLRPMIQEYLDVFGDNVITHKRLVGVGSMSEADCISYAVTGPAGRASGCHNICGLTPHAGQSLQRIVVVGYFASVSLHQPLCHTDQMLCFGVRIRDGFHQLINFFDRGRSHRLRVRETTK